MLALMFISFVGVMFCESALKLVGCWLGTGKDKTETLKFIGLGIGGVLAAIGAIALNRRATAQEKNNDDIRFQDMMTGLGDQNSTVRVATFYRFYYLASKKIQTDEFRNNIFEMLCSCLRTMSSELPYAPKEKYEYLTESQILFDILFKGKFKSNDPMKLGLAHDKIKTDLRNARFADIDFSDANLSRVDFRKAQFINVNLKDVYCVKGANFRGATINGKQVSINHFPKGSECRTDDNNPMRKRILGFDE